jgi:hypothetical protein
MKVYLVIQECEYTSNGDDSVSSVRVLSVHTSRAAASTAARRVQLPDDFDFANGAFTGTLMDVYVIEKPLKGVVKAHPKKAYGWRSFDEIYIFGTKSLPDILIPGGSKL